MKGLWLLMGGAVIFFGIGAGAISYWRQHRELPKPAAVAPLELPSGSEINLQGKIQSQNILGVPAPVDGTLADAPVKPGDEVAEGQILGIIRNTRLEEDQKEAEAELSAANDKKDSAESALIAGRLEESRAGADASRARSEYQRVEKIYQRQALLNREGATPRRTYEAAEKDYLAAQTESKILDERVIQVRARIEQLSQDVDSLRQLAAEKETALETAREDSKSAEIRSPVNGIIVSILAQPGDEVKKGTPDFITIGVDLTALEVVLEPDPPILKRLKTGDPAMVQLAELAGDGLPGTIGSIENGRVIVKFASPTTLIRPGMSALVRLKLP